MKDVYVEEQFQEFRKLVVATKFSQVYDNTIEVALKLSSIVSVKLLLWIIKEMTDENFVTIRKAEKLDFISGCEGGSIGSVNRALKELVDSGLIFPSSPKGQRLGRFFVNPGYFWKSNNQKDRTNRIKEYYEFLKFKANEED